MGAPGFSRYTTEQPAAMTSLSRRGLSAVRPEMRARRLVEGATGGREETEVWNWTPWVSDVVVAKVANSAPPGLLDVVE